jgi:hypothetical protein
MTQSFKYLFPQATEEDKSLGNKEDHQTAECVCHKEAVISYMYSIYDFFFFLVGLGFELRGLHLQSRHSTLEPQLQSIFLWLFYFVGSTGV